MIDNQKPTFSAGLLKVNGDGEYAVEMSKAYNYIPDPWQESLVKQYYTENCLQMGISAPRQNGKNGFFEIIELYSPMILGQRILHTAHRRDTVMKHFSRLCTRWYENPNYPDLSKHVDVTHGSGFQEINFDNGGRITFITRSDSGGRGDSVDVVILDEAQEMTNAEWSAIVPTLTASPNAKILLGGTPPDSSRTGKGIVFQRYRQKAYERNLIQGEVYFEWGIEDLKTDNIMDPEVWRRVNPAWDYRINKNIIRLDATTMESEEFAREHLGYWYKGAKNTIYNQDIWDRGNIAKRPEKDSVNRYAVGITYSQDGEYWSASMGMILDDDSLYVELMDLASMKKGTAQIMQLISHFDKDEKFVGVLAYGKAGTMNLLDDAEAAELFNPKIIEICRHDVKIASNSFFDNQMSVGAISHIEQEPLKESILSLDKYIGNRQGGGFNFVSRAGKLSASESAALSIYWAKNRKPKAKKKQEVW